MREIFRGERVRRCGGVVRERLQGGAGVEGHADAGEFLEPGEVVGVEGDAEVGEGTQAGRIVGVAGGEHTGSGGGGLREGSTLIEDGYTGAAAVEFEGERKADDAGAGDADVRAVHKISLVGFCGGYSLGV